MSAPSFVALGKVSSIQSGIGFPLTLQGRVHGKYPFAKVGDISKLSRAGRSDLFEAENYVNDEDLLTLRAKPIPVGSVVFAKIGEAIRQNFRAITMKPLLVDNNVMSVSPNIAILDLRYFYHFFRHLDIYPLADSTAVPSIRKSTMMRVMVPILPMAEQRSISGLLDNADALRATRQASICILDDLAQSIFLSMFGNPVRNDRSWPLAKVGDFVYGFESGKNIASPPGEPGGGYRILKVSAVTSGIFNPSESKPAPVGYSPPEAHVVRDSDLLFSRANTSELVGATALVRNPPAGILLPDKLWRFKWYTPNRTDPIYVNYLFKQPEFRAVVTRNATGSSGSMKNISQAKVLAISCGLPPLELQQEFGKRIKYVNSLRRSQVEHLVQLDSLFASLQYRAFSGELSGLGIG